MVEEDKERHSPEGTVQDLKRAFPAAFEELKLGSRNVITGEVKREMLLKVGRYLKDVLGFEHLSLISSIDWVSDYACMYHITSYQHGLMCELHVRMPKDDPTVESLTPLWRGAYVHEREAYDMMGIVFKNHPNLKRILLPDDYPYHPLRKDFPLEGLPYD